MIRSCWYLLLIFLLSSCTVEKLFPEEVANGVARLTVHNLGNLLRALNDDNTYKLANTDKRVECNLRGLQVTQTTEIQDQLNGRGKVVRSFTDCEFDFGIGGHSIDVISGCGAERITFFGKVTVSGTRTISGILTGNAKTPVIPSGSEGIAFHFTKVKFAHYRVESSLQEKAMTIATGTASFDVDVHLAKNTKSGLCEIPLPNITLRNIQYSPGESPSETIVFAPGPLGVFQAAIDGSMMQAQVGVYQDKINWLDGTIQVWGKSYQVPTDDPGLHPGFTVKAYEESVTCNPDLIPPDTDGCPYEPDLATNIARLTVKNLAHLMAAVANSNQTHIREECNLGKINQTPTETRNLDARLAELTWRFKDCEYSYDGGTVKVSGTRRISGYLLKDQNNPIIPGPKGVQFNFSLVEINNALNVKTGAIAFDVDVHLAKGKSTSLCTAILPNLTFSNIRYLKPSDLTIATDFGNIHLVVNDSRINAQLYRFSTTENSLSGSIHMFGKWIDIEQRLDPDYKSSDYESLLAAKTELLLPIDENCGNDEFERLRTLNVARLLVLNLGSITAEAQTEYLKSNNYWPNCGFSSNKVRAWPTQVKKKSGLFGEMYFRIQDCPVVQASKTEYYPSDCNGEKTAFEGRATVTGTQQVEGQLRTYARFFDDISPTHPRAINFTLSDVTFDNFASYYLRDGKTDPVGKLRLLKGTLAADVYPVLAPQKGAPCEFVRSTPIVGFRIRANKPIAAELLIRLPNLNYQSALTIDGADITAQNGVYQGVGNLLSGEISVDGKRFVFRDEKLNPDYSQATFDRGYACQSEIEYVIPYWQGFKPNCP